MPAGALAGLLNARQALGRRLVTGELALGNPRNRDRLLEAVQGLPQANAANEEEVLDCIARHAFSGLGMG